MWNKFSIVDMFVAWIVADLTKRRIAAQSAVDAAMACAPILETICDFPSDEAHPDNMQDVFLAVAYRIAKSNSILGLKLTADEPPLVHLIEAETSVRVALNQGFSILIDLRNLILVVGTVVIDDVDFENAQGERSRWIGQFSDLRKAEAEARSSAGRMVASATVSGKRRAVRK